MTSIKQIRYYHRAIAPAIRRGVTPALSRLQRQLTTLKRSLETSRRELSGLRELHDRLPVGIHALDSRGIIISVNRTEAELLGYQKREMVGRSFLDFIPENQREEAWDRFQQKLQGNAVGKIAHRTYLKKNGSSIYVSSEDRLLRDPHGNVVGVGTVLIDITELKQVQDQEAELKKLRALSQLAGGVAHHFNNLLAGIMMAAEMVGKSAGDGSTRELMRGTVEECQKGARITEAVLHYTRQAVLPYFAVSDPGLAVSEVASELRGIYSALGIQLSVQASHHSRIMADPRQLDKALRNLCQNAADALPQGGQIRITVEDRDYQQRQRTVSPRVLEPGKYITISVEDNGPGIPAELRDRVFEPFFSTDTVSKAGMGLPEVLGIIEGMNGGVRLINVQKGTKIKLLVPVSQ